MMFYAGVLIEKGGGQVVIKEGDIVGRKSYGCDIYFKVMAIYAAEDGHTYARLKGLDLRLEATSRLDDLCKIDPVAVNQYWLKVMRTTHDKMRHVFQRRQAEKQGCLLRAVKNGEEVESFDLPGTVLHVDGDKDYLEMCLTAYKQLHLTCYGYHIAEEKQAGEIYNLLVIHRPDILVVTGHDGLIKNASNYSDINSYHNSRHFVAAVQEARRYEKSRDDLVIFAGACQSHYEAILAAGANFASSPKRVLIHAYDPVFVVEKVAFTSIYDPIALKDVIASTITGFDGIGGLETRGKYRLGLPKSLY